MCARVCTSTVVHREEGGGKKKRKEKKEFAAFSFLSAYFHTEKHTSQHYAGKSSCWSLLLITQAAAKVDCVRKCKACAQNG